ncbi:MAG: RrF2 family transcriptional regulator, partial [Ruminococcus sp.]
YYILVGGLCQVLLYYIIPMLVRSGIIRTNCGNKGGYRLSKSAYDCTVGEILRATEGELSPVEETSDTTDETIKFVWEGLYNTINQYVDHISLQDIIEHSTESYSYNI